MPGEISGRPGLLPLEVDDDGGLLARAAGAFFRHRNLAVALRRFDLRVLCPSHLVVTVAAIGCCLSHRPSLDSVAQCIALR